MDNVLNNDIMQYKKPLSASHTVVAAAAASLTRYCTDFKYTPQYNGFSTEQKAPSPLIGYSSEECHDVQ